jgi:hypothetical protein
MVGTNDHFRIEGFTRHFGDRFAVAFPLLTRFHDRGQVVRIAGGKTIATHVRTRRP